MSSAQTKANNQKSKNPLYLVSNRGKVVEVVENWWSYWPKKMGVYNYLVNIWNLFQFIVEKIPGYASVQIVNQLFQQVFDEIKTVAGNFQVLFNL